MPAVIHEQLHGLFHPIGGVPGKGDVTTASWPAIMSRKLDLPTLVRPNRPICRRMDLGVGFIIDLRDGDTLSTLEAGSAQKTVHSSVLGKSKGGARQDAKGMTQQIICITNKLSKGGAWIGV